MTKREGYSTVHSTLSRGGQKKFGDDKDIFGWLGLPNEIEIDFLVDRRLDPLDSPNQRPAEVALFIL